MSGSRRCAVTTPTLPNPAVDPGGYVLAVADLRERRIAAVRPERWRAWPAALPGEWTIAGVTRGGNADRHPIATTHGLHSAEVEAVHIAAEANPAHALAEVALWRGIVERHGDHGGASNYRGEPDPALCHGCAERWPCPDLLAVVAAAQAYMGAS